MHGRLGSSPSLDLQSLLLAALAPVLLWAATAASAAQELPSGGGPIPPVRRGADGRIELVAPNAFARPGRNRQHASPATRAPKPLSPEIGGNSATAPARAALPSRSRQPVITVTPITPRVPDTTPRGAIVARYSVVMSDGAPFTGRLRFAAPNYDADRVFAISGDKIIVNPNGPGLGRYKTTSTYHITLETFP